MKVSSEILTELYYDQSYFESTDERPYEYVQHYEERDMDTRQILELIFKSGDRFYRARGTAEWNYVEEGFDVYFNEDCEEVKKVIIESYRWEKV